MRTESAYEYLGGFAGSRSIQMPSTAAKPATTTPVSVTTRPVSRSPPKKLPIVSHTVCVLPVDVRVRAAITLGRTSAPVNDDPKPNSLQTPPDFSPLLEHLVRRRGFRGDALGLILQPRHVRQPTRIRSEPPPPRLFGQGRRRTPRQGARDAAD